MSLEHFPFRGNSRSIIPSRNLTFLGACWLAVFSAALVIAQEEPAAEETPASSPRGSLIEDQAAKKLLEAADARVEADEPAKAVDIWQSVIERYPRSRFRFDAHMKLGKYLLDQERAYDRARGHFQAASEEDNRDEDQRAEATLRVGQCFYEARNFGMCFKVMREVIEKFPVSPQVNEAYYYIGLGHFQLGHYSRAIDALQKVGTAFSGDQLNLEKVEAGKRLFVKIEDADLSALDNNQTVNVQAETTQGDKEIVVCYTLGRNVRVVLGSIVTDLGKPQPGNGKLEVRGDDVVKITYVDSHTSDRQFNRPVGKDIVVVGNGIAQITDGAFKETLAGIVLDRQVNVQVIDADQDLSDEADKVKAIVAIYRPKTPQEIEKEKADLVASAAEGTTAPLDAVEEEVKVEKYREIDRVEIDLSEIQAKPQLPGVEDSPAVPGLPPAYDGTEQDPAASGTAPPEKTSADPPKNNPPAAEPSKEEPPAESAPPTATQPTPAEPDNSFHSGIFRAVIPLARAEEPIVGDDILQGQTGDIVKVMYVDERHRGDEPRTLVAQAECIQGDLGKLRVTRTQITDQELLVKTRLKTADALTNIGNRYKEFGLKDNANKKYEEALAVCEEITELAGKLGGRLLEDTYVQLWRIYFEMDRLELAASMAQRLQQEFPNSAYIDDALLQLAEVARKQKEYGRAIGLFQRLVEMKTSQLRGEAQFGVAQCYEEMAKDEQTRGGQATQLFDRSFQEYKKVYDQFPDSGRVGEAVAKMANYYYEQQDFSRAVDTFETVLNDHPDAKFLDVILWNYGKCLYRMNRTADAKSKWDQLIAEFPESQFAIDAKKVSDALAKQSSGASGG